MGMIYRFLERLSERRRKWEISQGYVVWGNFNGDLYVHSEAVIMDPDFDKILDQVEDIRKMQEDSRR